MPRCPVSGCRVVPTTTLQPCSSCLDSQCPRVAHPTRAKSLHSAGDGQTTASHSTCILSTNTSGQYVSRASPVLRVRNQHTRKHYLLIQSGCTIHHLGAWRFLRTCICCISIAYIACGNLDHPSRLTRSTRLADNRAAQFEYWCDRRQAAIVSASFDCLYIAGVYRTILIHTILYTRNVSYNETTTT